MIFAYYCTSTNPFAHVHITRVYVTVICKMNTSMGSMQIEISSWDSLCKYQTSWNTWRWRAIIFAIVSSKEIKGTIFDENRTRLDEIRSPSNAYLEASCFFLPGTSRAKRCTCAPLDEFEPDRLDRLDRTDRFISSRRLWESWDYTEIRLVVVASRWEEFVSSDLHTFNVNERNSWLGTSMRRKKQPWNVFSSCYTDIVCSLRYGRRYSKMLIALNRQLDYFFFKWTARSLESSLRKLDVAALRRLTSYGGGDAVEINNIGSVIDDYIVIFNSRKIMLRISGYWYLAF